jgi:AcrR family transcriptional regulator
MDSKQSIIEQSLVLFLKSGVKSVNMDEISSNLGISKKTLYLHVDNKQDLVQQCFELHTQKVTHIISQSSQKFDNAIDELFAIDEAVSVIMKQTNPYTLGELKRYYPQTWLLVEDFKKKVLFDILNNNLHKGMKQGLYRENLNSDIIAKLMLSRTDVLINDDIFPLTKYNFRELLKENRIYHIRGIATKTGINYLEKKINEN